MNPTVSTIIITALVIVAIGIVLNIGNPIISKSQTSAQIQEAEEIMKHLDNYIKEIASEGNGSSRIFSFTASGGSFVADAREDSIQFKINGPRTMEYLSRKKRGDLYTISGNDVDCSATANNLIMSNSRLNITFQKKGSSSGWVAINTSQNILNITQRDLGITVNFTNTSIMINDDSTTSNGTGYSEILRTGDNRPFCIAHFHINSSVEYDIYYTLFAGADFLVQEVRDSLTAKTITTNLAFHIGDNDTIRINETSINTKTSAHAHNATGTDGSTHTLKIRASDDIYADLVDFSDEVNTYMDIEFADLGIPPSATIDDVVFQVEYHTNSFTSASGCGDKRDDFEVYNGTGYQCVEDWGHDTSGSDVWWNSSDVSNIIDTGEKANNIKIRLRWDPEGTNEILYLDTVKVLINYTVNETFTPSKKYITSQNGNLVAGLVFAGSHFYNISLDANSTAEDYLFQLRQSARDNKVLIPVTNGTWNNIDDKIMEVDQDKLIGTTFGDFSVSQPNSAWTYLALIYDDINLTKNIRWGAGSHEIFIKNAGKVNDKTKIEMNITE